MEASLSAFGGVGDSAGGLVPLTPEQVASLRSAIMLLQQGDGLEDLEFALPGAGPMQAGDPVDPVHDDSAHEPEHDDRDSFGGMYS